jgi:hypothetical protein
VLHMLYAVLHMWYAVLHEHVVSKINLQSSFTCITAERELERERELANMDDDEQEDENQLVCFSSS